MALVVAEVALALVLLVGALLCLKGSRKAQALDIGFDPRQVLLAGLRIGMHSYDEPRGLVFYWQLREQLAAMGIGGVMAYIVSQRTREMGIQLTVGGSAQRLIHLVLSQGMKLTAWGFALGLIGAVALSHSLTNSLYGVSPFDLLTFAGVVVILAVVSLAACFVPAWRAASVDPMTALRSE